MVFGQLAGWIDELWVPIVIEGSVHVQTQWAGLSYMYTC